MLHGTMASAFGVVHCRLVPGSYYRGDKENMRDLAERFAALFRGNDRSHGFFYPSNGGMETVKKKITMSDFERHLSGKVGVGVVPIMDDDQCWFGAIDIDAHGDTPDIELDELEEGIRENDLPLVLCRSKSGGAHLYVFMTEPVAAKTMRKVLSNWAGILGHAGVEIFPKQESLPESGGEKQLGNWINLCYFSAD